MSAERSAGDWAKIIVLAYKKDTRPPLTDHLCAEVVDKLEAAIASAEPGDPDLPRRVNAALDDFEQDLNSVAGPRLASLDVEAGVAHMGPRDDGGHPLRGFGGQ